VFPHRAIVFSVLGCIEMQWARFLHKKTYYTVSHGITDASTSSLRYKRESLLCLEAGNLIGSRFTFDVRCFMLLDKTEVTAARTENT